MDEIFWDDEALNHIAERNIVEEEVEELLNSRYLRNNMDRMPIKSMGRPMQDAT